METLGISHLLLKHVGIDDSDATVANFIISIYNQVKLLKGEVFSNFKRELSVNGGEFPDEFINDVIAILQIKQEPQSQLHPQSQSQTSIKQENLQIPSSLVIPNKKVEFDDTEDLKVTVNPLKPTISYEKPRAGGIYQGIITNVTNFGAFIKVNGITGLCHVSQISFDGSVRIQLANDFLKLHQQVFVKVLSIDTNNGKMSLSMRGIDQANGLDRTEELDRGRQLQIQQPKKRRLTSPEKWEIRQLINSGVSKAEDYPELDGFDDIQETKIEPEIDVDIEMKFKEPTFLKGQTLDLYNLEPAKIVKNPEGSLQRAAMKGSTLAKEFKEKRFKEQKEKEKQDRLKAAKSMDYLDPLKSQTKTITKEVNSSWKKSQEGVTYGKRSSLSIQQQRESLPVYLMKQQLMDKIDKNQFLVVVGETGSGKTTQIVQYLAEAGYNNQNGQHKIIGCTQPRRVAAQSVAKRVAEERGTKLGTDVGYTIRFDDNSKPTTNIKYMTDGMLQREAINDALMSKYSVIMLDEAHERTLATDVLFALLKQAAKENPNLKVIITSATLDSQKFSRYFNNCDIVNIPGRTYPVDVLYTREPEFDYLLAAINCVMQIHVAEPPGDILVFLTGQEEIDTSCEVLFEKIKTFDSSIPELIILPVYSSLPSEIQSKIFEPTPQGSRKVILATNIAETSITIDGIYYVIDPGFVKINAYDPKLGMDSLIVSPISQAQANQRSGRAGRTGPGKCYRLYTEKAFNEEMLPNSVPEIQRSNLSNTILLLKTMGINDLLTFEFMDPPKTMSLLNALQELYTLEALDDKGYLTRLGKRMSEFPMEPKLAKTLIVSVELQCSEEILTIVAMLSTQSVFYRPKNKANLADQRKARFHHSLGDHVTLLNVYRSWVMNGYNKQWCNDNFIHERSLRQAQDVKNQIMKIMNQRHLLLISCGLDYDKVIRALCSGFFKHAAKRNHQEGYRTLVEDTTVYLHPSSALQNKNPEYVIYHTLLLTTKEYMQCTTIIEPQMLLEVAPSYFQQSDGTKNKRQKVVPLYDKFGGEESWRLSAQIASKNKALSTLHE